MGRKGLGLYIPRMLQKIFYPQFVSQAGQRQEETICNYSKREKQSHRLFFGFDGEPGLKYYAP